jgi:hypothetical protein
MSYPIAPIQSPSFYVPPSGDAAEPEKTGDKKTQDQNDGNAGTESRFVLGANLSWQGVFPLIDSDLSYPNLAVGGGLNAGYRFTPNSPFFAGGAIDAHVLQSPVVPKSVDPEAHILTRKEKEGVYVSVKPTLGVTGENLFNVYIKAGPSLIYQDSTQQAEFGLGGDLVIGGGLYLSAGGDYLLESNQTIGRLTIGIGN